MNKTLFLIVALFAFFAFLAISNARPIMFIASQTDGVFGISNGWVGVSFAFVTKGKGNLSHRLNIFGLTNINESYTGAWIQYANGTIIDQLAYGITSSEKYFLGDLRLNDTIFNSFLNEDIYVTVASTSHRNGSVSGYYKCKPHLGFAALDDDQFNDAGGNSTTSAIGIGYAQILVGVQSTGLPNDILQQDDDIASTSTFQGTIIYNVSSPTSATFNGPANTTETASILATGTLHTTSFSQNYASWSNITINNDFYSIDNGDTYYEILSSENIRGQVYPVVSPTRRSIPISIDTIDGNTTVPAAGYGTLRYANQQGTEKNFNSFVRFEAISDGTNFTYLAVISFEAATNKKNDVLVRALTLEMNLRIIGSGTWFFEFYDNSLGQYIPAGTISNATDWTPAYIDNYSVAVNGYSNKRRINIVRVSTTSSTSTTLWVDLMGLRSWVPSSNSNTFFKIVSKLTATFPAKFSNGTEIHTS